ncbi:DUF998 domain-containing protein [Stenotrophomonas sp. JAG2]|uniref:DUF998 domain-containing protein n=1 Tax=Stenotrophomonas sp. JAG2 TaxID=3229243 RepID=UPI0034E26729
MSGLHRWERALGIAAAVLFVGAVLGFGAALPLFDPIGHPVALLGAMGVPHALAFNIVGFALPGLLASLVALRLLLRVPRTAPWSMRVGAQLLMLAGVGFTAMGVLPLDTSDLDNPASQYHASAWMVWVLAFVPGAVMSGIGALRLPAWQAVGALHLACGLGVLLSAFALQVLLPAPLAQRVAFGVWLVWLVAVLPLAPGARRA